LYAYGSSTIFSTLYTVGSTSDYAYGTFGDSAPFTQHTDYALLTGLTTSSGTLTIGLNYYGTGTAPVISALQLVSESTVTPVPSTLVMSSILLGVVWSYKRLKQTAAA
jgi:hypothetical protein